LINPVFSPTFGLLADLVAQPLRNSIAASLTPFADWVRRFDEARMEPTMSGALRKYTNIDHTQFTERVLIRCPASLPPARSRAAAKNLMTPSEYVRRCVIERLKTDGIDPAQLADAD
jgi:hypothetical protein